MSNPNDTLDAIKGEIAQMAEVMRTHRAADDMATVDSKALVKAITGLLEQQTAAVAAQNTPRYLGEEIPAETPLRAEVRGGKYDGQAVQDVVWAEWFMRRARTIDAKMPAPSRDLSDAVKRALTATGAGTGDEYVPTHMAATLWRDMFLMSKVGGALGKISMPTDPFDIPLGWGQTTWRKGTQNTATTVSDPATAKSTLTSTEQVTEINWSYDLDEDAIVAVMPTLRQELARDGAEQIDRFILNADATNAGTGNINLDDADPDDDSYYLSAGQDGIRHFYLVDNTAQSTDINTTLTDALLRAGIARLGKYAADVDNLVMVTDVETYVNGMLALTNVVTVDKFGPRATVLTGALSSYQGIPIIVSGAMAEAEDDGKVSTTANNNDEGQIALFHRDMWKVGFRRQLLMEVDRNIQKRQFLMVVSFRIAVAARGTRSTAKHTAGIHGIVRA